MYLASPSEYQRPRGSTLTMAYPSAHQCVGSGPSKIVYSASSHSVRTPLPGKREYLEGWKMLAVRSPRDQHGHVGRLLRAKTVRVDRDAVAEPDGDVALDHHSAVAGDPVTKTRVETFGRRSPGSPDDLDRRR